jgi:phosphoglycolate phosphatase
MNLFLDLDGTLIDSKERLYRLFSHLVPRSEMDYDEYWGHKKNGIGHAGILRRLFDYSDESVDRFQEEWLGLIERPEWIKYDKPLPGITEKLGELKGRYTLILITARQFTDVVDEQLAQFGWNGLFRSVLVTKQEREKKDLIREHFETTPGDWLIGDTGKDIQTGKYLNMKTAAVLTGFLGRGKLEGYRPDMILNSLLDFNY